MVPMLDMGSLPLANRLENAGSTSDKAYPLVVYFCHNCALIQLADLVPRNEMFADYVYLTSASKTMMEHFDRYAETVTQRLDLTTKDIVLDVGSNDGTLLKAFQRRGARVLGIEPAQNVASIAQQGGVPTLTEYFDLKLAKKLKKVRLVTANNILSHVGNLRDFLATIAQVLRPDGLFVFEVPWVADVLRNNSFDMIYHEHLTYFGLKPLARTLRVAGLSLVDLEYFPSIHGGTFRGFASPVSEEPSPVVREMSTREANEADFWALKDFSERVPKLAHQLRSMLLGLKEEGKRIAGYGAPAKATILLNYCNIGRDVLDYASDTTPLKQGKFIPGVRVPVVDHQLVRAKPPDYYLLLAWNFREEILAKEKRFLDRGGKFVIPFPHPEVVGSEGQFRPTTK
jgi:2-polyprenyl-3-methyl-5-hydroxy-6-metoxy-1,4-benzoquinol methylase